MLPLVLDYLPHLPVGQQPMELVERKGLGHPDSICDAIMEAISVALCQTYLNATGQVLHHNIDKSLLVAGQTTPALGGGTVEAPMRLIVGDRATVEWQGQRFPVGAIAEATAARGSRPYRSFWRLAPAGRTSKPLSARSCTPTWRRSRRSSRDSRRALFPATASAEGRQLNGAPSPCGESRMRCGRRGEEAESASIRTKEDKAMTGLDVFDTTVQKTNVWLKDIMQELGWEDRHKAYVGLRTTLHALRDRLTPEEAAQFGAQLPMLIRGLYYEGWTPTGKPEKVRHKAEFLAPIRDYFRDDWHVEPEEIARAVLKVLTQHVSAGEVADVKHCFPTELRALWP